MSQEEQLYQILYFPYLGMRGETEVRYGPLRLWNASTLAEKLEPGPLLDRLTAVLESHRAPSGRADRSSPLQGIGVVSRGAVDFAPLVPRRAAEIQELRYALFLACLARNVMTHGPNAGHHMYTAENFSFVTQGISLTSPYISEVTGVLVSVTHMGYKIGEVQWPTPTHIPRPLTFDYDDALLGALDRLRRIDKPVYRRILDATSLFLESFHNTHALDVRARILLQAASFEVLLDLPSRQQRLAFKDRVELYCATPSERRYHHKYETPGGLRPDSRTQKGIWADRFYTLRNHIIHGESVHSSQYLYRGVQHHVLIAAVFFVHIAKRLIEDAVGASGEAIRFYSEIDWVPASIDPDDDDDDFNGGFQSRTDFVAYFSEKLAAAGWGED